VQAHAPSKSPPATSLDLEVRRLRSVRPASLRGWIVGLAAADLGAVGLATTVAVGIRLDRVPHEIAGVPRLWFALALVLVWPVVLLANGAYDTRCQATGSEEFRRVGQAGLWLLGGVAFLAFLVRAEPPRAVILLGIPLTVVLTSLERYAARRVLQRRITSGSPLYRTFVVGSSHDVRQLVRYIERMPWVGFSVVATSTRSADAAVEPREPAAAAEALITEVEASGADTIAIAGSGALGDGMLRALAWRLEGTGIRLVMAPSVTDIAGPRIVVRPVQGLPLLHVEDPELRAGQRVLKSSIDRLVAGVALIALAPAFVAIALAIRLTSRGPVLFRQERVGLRGGRTFTIWKFRTMVAGAERRVDEVAHLNEHDGPLFKIRQDPRVTAVGRWLRRFSIDELPQLVNVLRGDMSLVGPRPPLPSEVAGYRDEAGRRLLVKPGMTGLWQVGGRALLPWEEAVRLDLYYVENWSVALDLMVLWKTFGAVLHGRGAY
jgi:exopolysaccharide biosynthesis polyprenyl glycosylphosphotransferase